MAKRRRKGMSGKVYALLLTVYIIILAGAAIFALTKVWDYAEEYELAQPTNVMDEYVAQLNANLSNMSIRDTVAAMEHEMQTDEECVEIIESMLSGGVTYTRAPSPGDGSICYALKCDAGSFGKVYLSEDKSYEDESKFGMLPWKIVREEFDFTGLYTGVEITVPESYYVFLNGNKLGEEYIVERDIPYDVLSEYYDDYQGLPTKVTYRFENLIGLVEPVIKNEDGQVTAIDSSRDDSQYLRQCSEKERADLQRFGEGFCKEYYIFLAGLYDPTYAYTRVQPYVKLGSDLDQRLKMAFDGLYFAHTRDVTTDSVVLNDALWLADGLYLAMYTGTYTTVTADGTVEQKSENMKLIIVEAAGEYRAVSHELY